MSLLYQIESQSLGSLVVGLLIGGLVLVVLGPMALVWRTLLSGYSLEQEVRKTKRKAVRALDAMDAGLRDQRSTRLCGWMRLSDYLILISQRERRASVFPPPTVADYEFADQLREQLPQSKEPAEHVASEVARVRGVVRDAAVSEEDRERIILAVRSVSGP